MKSDENRETDREREKERTREGQRGRGVGEDTRAKDGEQERGARAEFSRCVNGHYVGECVVCLWSETNK